MQPIVDNSLVTSLKRDFACNLIALHQKNILRIKTVKALFRFKINHLSQLKNKNDSQYDDTESKMEL
jgi:hypothetical protein